MPRAVVLLSGGLDSTTTLAFAKNAGYEVFALSVDYGQRHRIELLRAAIIAKKLNAVEHRTIALDLRSLGGSSLTTSADVPKDRSVVEMATGIPSTYVPARNTMLLAAALSYAETIGAFDLVFGANALDHGGYPDCRPEFFAAFTVLANTATAVGAAGHGRFRIHTPLIDRTKADIVRLGIELGVDLSLTTSCYDPDAEGRACGRCDACALRRAGFRDAGAADPTTYRDHPGLGADR